MDAKFLKECETLAFQNKLSFREAAKRLDRANVERYCTDLVSLEKFYYTAGGQTLTVKIPLKKAPKIGRLFLTDAVKSAVRDVQQGRLDYPEFLRALMRAGVVYYDVFVRGRRVIYTGRDGDFHVENFTSPKVPR